MNIYSRCSIRVTLSYWQSPISFNLKLSTDLYLFLAYVESEVLLLILEEGEEGEVCE